MLPVCRDKLEETKLLQRMRKKTSGMGADKLAQAGPAVARAVSEEPDADAPEHVARLMDSYVKATTIQESNDDEHMWVRVLWVGMGAARVGRDHGTPGASRNCCGRRDVRVRVSRVSRRGNRNREET